MKSKVVNGTLKEVRLSGLNNCSQGMKCNLGTEYINAASISVFLLVLLICNKNEKRKKIAKAK